MSPARIRNLCQQRQQTSRSGGSNHKNLRAKGKTSNSIHHPYALTPTTVRLKKTAWPWIDSHTHTYGDALKDAAVFGVTTELDMFSDIRSVQQVKRLEKEGKKHQHG